MESDVLVFEFYHYTETEIKNIIASMVILIDTREKEGHNDHIIRYLEDKKVPYKKKQLKYGDYSFMIPENKELGIMKPMYFDRKIIIERKHNLDELASNLVNDRDRIKKEFALSPQTKVLLIENASYEDLIDGKYRSQYSPVSYWATIHSLWHEFGIPVMFIKDQNYTGKFLLGYFRYYLKKLLT